MSATVTKESLDAFDWDVFVSGKFAELKAKLADKTAELAEEQAKTVRYAELEEKLKAAEDRLAAIRAAVS